MSYTWKEFFDEQRVQPYYQQLHEAVMEEYRKYTVYPPYRLILNAFRLTPFDNVKVVILGQDPYHNPRQAMGLSFSVPEGIDLPPSLVNIYKEIEAEYGIRVEQSGDLTYLARQGVLLVNSLLTVRENRPLSHKNFGYETLIENVMRKLDEDDAPKVFMLWGNSAKSMMRYLQNPRHLILTSAHPSPLSAHYGFFGNRHFVSANEFLERNGRAPICWIRKEAEALQ